MSSLFPFLPVPGQRPATPLLAARALVHGVLLAVQADQANAQLAGVVAVNETDIQTWFADLQSALASLSGVAVPLISPPPQWAVPMRQAMELIQSVMAMLRAIPVARSFLYPTVAGQAALSLQALSSLSVPLLQAQGYLDLAVRLL